MTVIYLGTAWLAGILLGSLLHLPSGFVGLVMLLPLAGLLLWRRDQRVRLISACFLCLLLGTLRFNASIPPQSFDEGDIAHYNDQGWVKIEGIVSSGLRTISRDLFPVWVLCASRTERPRVDLSGRSC